MKRIYTDNNKDDTGDDDNDDNFHFEGSQCVKGC